MPLPTKAGAVRNKEDKMQIDVHKDKSVHALCASKALAHYLPGRPLGHAVTPTAVSQSAGGSTALDVLGLRPAGLLSIPECRAQLWVQHQQQRFGNAK